MACSFDIKTGIADPLDRRGAKALVAPYALPNMGHETELVKVRDEYGLTACLYLQNISGTFVMASSTFKSEDWERIFGVKL